MVFGLARGKNRDGSDGVREQREGRGALEPVTSDCEGRGKGKGFAAERS